MNKKYGILEEGEIMKEDENVRYKSLIKETKVQVALETLRVLGNTESLAVENAKKVLADFLGEVSES